MENEERPVVFADIKAILDLLVKGREENLKFIHGNGMSWDDKAALANAIITPFGAEPGFRLIDPSLVGVGRAKETNLYIALTVGVGSFSQMPLDGPFATEEQLSAICEWIDAGMPD